MLTDSVLLGLLVAFDQPYSWCNILTDSVLLGLLVAFDQPYPRCNMLTDSVLLGLLVAFDQPYSWCNILTDSVLLGLLVVFDQPYPWCNMLTDSVLLGLLVAFDQPYPWCNMLTDSVLLGLLVAFDHGTLDCSWKMEIHCNHCKGAQGILKVTKNSLEWTSRQLFLKCLFEIAELIVVKLDHANSMSKSCLICSFIDIHDIVTTEFRIFLLKTKNA
jgi:hydrogenase/urease accessory protein HupE